MVLLLISQNFCQLLLKTITIVIVHCFWTFGFAPAPSTLSVLMSAFHQIINIIVCILLSSRRQYDCAFADRYTSQSKVLGYDDIAAYNMINNVQINRLVAAVHLNDIYSGLRFNPMIM